VKLCTKLSDLTGGAKDRGDDGENNETNEKRRDGRGEKFTVIYVALGQVRQTGANYRDHAKSSRHDIRW